MGEHDRARHEQLLEALREREAELRLASRAARMAIFRWEVATGRVGISETGPEVFDLDGFDGTLEGWRQLIHPDDLARVDRELVVVLTSPPGITHSLAYRHVWPGGEIRWAEVRGQVLTDERGEPTVAVGVVLDVTDRVLLAQALREREALFRALVEHTSDVLTILDLDGTIRYESPAIERIAGYAPEERVGRNAFDFLHPDDVAPVRELFRRAAADPAFVSDAEFRVRHRDGRWIALEALGRSAVGDPALRGIVVTSRDVTRRRELEAQLRQAQKMEALGTLAGGLAHDFNNLLAVILSSSELLLADLPGDDPLRDDVERIRSAGERAAALTQQLLAFGRRQVVQPRPLALPDALREAEPMLRRLIGSSIALELEIDESVPAVRMDPTQLTQVLLNLAANARDAMEGGGTLRIGAAVERVEAGSPVHAGLPPGDYVALRVSDTGIGMDEATLRQVFDPFFTTKEPGRGTGLGLATVHGIVEQARGRVAVRSEPGAGTTFTILLPPEEAPAGVPAKGGAAQPLPRGGETVLLVEDERSLRASTARLLHRLGYTVLEARHGADALRVVEASTGSVDLVLTDVVMPEMDGRELVARLRARWPGLPVLLMSGYDERRLTEGHPALHDTPFVEKPFTAADLARRIREALDRARP